jgi:hypothetical protein
MTRPGLWTGLASLVAASAVALLAAAAAGAWTAAAQPAGRVAESGRDFSGVWMPSHWYHLLGGGDPGNLPRNTLFSFPLPKAVAEREALLTPWGRERRSAWTPENDPDARCLSPGAVRAYQSPYPIEFLATPGRMTILFEYQHLVRRIHMDGRGHPKDFDVAPMGHSIGRWEGDTLVVETVGLADTTLLNATGLPHSDQMTLTERIRRILDGTVLEIEFTIADPVAYTKPWTATSYFKRDPAGQIIEYNCDLVVDYRKPPP